MNKPDLTGRHLLTLHHLTDGELFHLLELASELKEQKRSGSAGQRLRGKNIALVFEKSSTRTRCAASVAAADEGGHAEYLGVSDTHLGKKESITDTARVLGRMFDGILFRGYLQQTVEDLAQFAGVPVWNGLTDESHPTQGLADLMTVREHFGQLRGLKLVYVGDGRNNVANSLMAACVKTGMHFVNCTPESLSPCPDLVKAAEKGAQRNGCSVRIERDPVLAVKDANVICTDVWASMGEEDQMAERIALLQPYQVNMDLMRQTGNLEANRVIFLHCLPAFHDAKTVVTAEIGAMEVTDEVFEAPFSKVFDEAENRVHTMKAVFVASLSREGDACAGE